jgi:hypothetical protein
MRLDETSLQSQARNSVLTTASALALVFAGMLLLPGGLGRVIAM